MKFNRLTWREKILGAAVVLGAATIAVLFYFGPHSASPVPDAYMSRVAGLWCIPFFDAIPQSSSYRTFLLSLVLLALIAVFFSGKWDAHATIAGRSADAGGLCGRILRTMPWVAGVLFLYPLWSNGLTTMGADGRELKWVMATSVVLVFTFGIALRLIRPAILTAICWIAIAGYASALLVPGFFTPVSLENDSLLLQVDWHFDSVMGSAEQIRDGLRAFSDIRPPYGLLGPGFIGIAEKLLGQFDFAGHIRLVQCFQCAFLVLALASYRAWMPRSALFVVVGALLVGPYLATSHPAIIFPNQSGWRFIGVPIAVLLLPAARHLSLGMRALILGLIVGFLNLHAPELSIVVGGGYAAFLLAGTGVPLRPRWPRRELFFLAGIAAAWAAYLLTHRMAYGAFPDHCGRIFGTIVRVTNSGFSGAPFYFDPVFVLVAALSAYRCATLFLKSVSRGLAYREQCVFAIAVMSLIWLAYFMNRADRWNLWQQIYLMPFLLPRSLFVFPAARLGPRRPLVFVSLSKIRLRLTRAACLYTLFLGPLMVSANVVYFRQPPIMVPQAGVGPPVNERPKASGILVTPHAADLLAQRSAFLHSHEKEGVHCVTKLPYTTRLLAGSPRVWVTNPFIQYAREDFGAFVSTALQKAPRFIVIDPPNDGMLPDPKAEKNWQLLCKLFRSKLSGKYQQTGTSDGWEIWEKLPGPAANPGS